VDNHSQDYAKVFAYLRRQAILSSGIGVYFIIKISEIIVKKACLISVIFKPSTWSTVHRLGCVPYEHDSRLCLG
jgi:hypothetical protein